MRKDQREGRERGVSGMQSAVRYTCTITAILHRVGAVVSSPGDLRSDLCLSPPHLALSSPLPPTSALNEFRSSSLFERKRERERRSNLNQPNLTRTVPSPLRARARDNALWVPRTSLTRELAPHYHHHHDRFDECPLRLTWGINRGGVG